MLFLISFSLHYLYGMFWLQGKIRLEDMEKVGVVQFFSERY